MAGILSVSMTTVPKALAKKMAGILLLFMTAGPFGDRGRLLASPPVVGDY